MKKTLTYLGLALPLLALASPSYATFNLPDGITIQDIINWWCSHFGGCTSPQGGTNPTNSVPEIDGAGAAIALSLLAGFTAIVRERRKKQS